MENSIKVIPEGDEKANANLFRHKFMPELKLKCVKRWKRHQFRLRRLLSLRKCYGKFHLRCECDELADKDIKLLLRSMSFWLKSIYQASFAIDCGQCFIPFAIWTNLWNFFTTDMIFIWSMLFVSKSKFYSMQVAIENKIIGQNVGSLDFIGLNRNSVVQLQ